MDELENVHGISLEQAGRIKEDLSLLDESRPGLAAEVLGYVLRGENEAVLAELKGSTEAYRHLRLITSGQLRWREEPIRESRLELLRHWETGDGAVPYRWGRVLRAGMGFFKQEYFYGLVPEGLRWLVLLLKEGSGWGMNKCEQVVEAGVQWTVSDFERILEAAPDCQPSDLVMVAVKGRAVLSMSLDTVTGLGARFAEWPEELLRFLDSSDKDEKSSVLSVMGRLAVPLRGALLRKVAEIAVGGWTDYRKSAAGLLRKHAVDAAEAVMCIRDLAEKGKATERRHAVPLVLEFLGEDALPYLKEWLERERTKSVRDEVELALQSASHGESGEQEFEVPEPRKYDERVELSPEMVEDLKLRIAKHNASEMEKHGKWWDGQDPRWRQGEREIAPPVTEAMLEGILEALRVPDHCREGKLLLGDNAVRWNRDEFDASMDEFVREHEVGWVGMIRMMWIEGLFQRWFYGGGWAERLRDRLEKDPEMSLIDLAAAFEAAGVGQDVVVSFYLGDWYEEVWNPLELSGEAIWPLFARRIDTVEKALGIGEVGGRGNQYELGERERAYRVLGLFPEIPKHLAPIIWKAALAGGKAERAMAQRCLEKEADRDEKIIAALADRRKGVREVAANWIGQLRLPVAEKVLCKVVAKEKADEPKAAMMEALERLGVDVDRFLDRKKLLAEAEKGLQKALPKGLDWFPFDDLPPVRWEKNRQQVSAEVVKWMLVQTVKIKKPEPGPLLRRYVGMMHPGERRALGGFVLDAWIDKDVPEGSKPGFDWETGSSSETTSAIDSKGLLAMAAAACEEEILPKVSVYLKTWYGWRPAQCKALLRMVSWIDQPVAVQYLFEISNRFRTRSIQREAAKIVEEVAERKGWTRGELADRTIPSGGFDLDGCQEIDYGTRCFTARLLEDLSIELKTAEGKVIKALPTARVDEDPDEVKVHKQAFTKAKKEIKQAAKILGERLHEAMCVERRWVFADWEFHLNRHPLAGRFCQRLVWMAFRDGERIGCFRPLADRSLSDAEDAAVVLEESDELQLAHASFLSAEEGEAWLQHLDDYEVPPLFTQFGQHAFVMDEERKKQKELTDFVGHLIDAFPLRRIATKLGYRRGPTEDGGWFHTYERPFPGLKVQAVLHMSGNRLPEDDEMVALLGMSFVSVGDEEEGGGRALRLGDLPEVLVGECWNDFRIIAGKGSGFDPEWEKAVGG